MLIVDDHVLNCLKWNIDNVVYLVKALFTCSFTLSLLKVEFQISYGPFTTVLVVIVGRLFGDSYICQMNKHVVSLVLVVAVLFDTESGEPKIIQIDLQRTVTCNQHIYTQVKLFPPDQKRILQVLWNYIWFLESLIVAERDFWFILPALQLREFRHEENSLTLCFVTRFHNPCCIWVTSKLFNKNVVITWENVRLGNNIHVNIATKFIFFSQWTVFTL